MLCEIKHRHSGAVLSSLECESLKICVEEAVSAHADLSYADLSYADLSYADLSYADLGSANLSYANLCSADLGSADLSSANLCCADFSSANLRYADLRHANLCCADFSSANLSSASLRSADLSYADLGSANLRYADLSSANLGSAAFIDGGEERRGFRFFAWRNKEGITAYRGGCHTWPNIDDALAHYGDGYKGSGDKDECIGRLAFLRDEAARRWPAEIAQVAA